MNKVDELTEIFGEELVLSGENADRGRLKRYGIDQVGDERYRRTPAAVVFPTTTDHVAALMRWASKSGTPITPRGGGSGLAGAAIPVEGGVVCSFEKMDRIIEIDTENFVAVVEPGVVTNALDAALEPYGLFFAGYPMSEDICFVGGNVAENAGGGRAIKYGTTARWIVGAEVVTADGSVMTLGGKRLKDVTGYNLLQLFIGSEGTLGLFTKVFIRVIPRPNVRGVVTAGFTDASDAARCVSDLTALHGYGPSAIEFIDGQTVRETNAGLATEERLERVDDVAALLLVEYDGNDEIQIDTALDFATDRVELRGGDVRERVRHPDAMERAWNVRKRVPWMVKRRAGRMHSLEDVVVPPAAIPELVDYVDTLRERYRLPIAVFGHAGDGNFHVTPMKADEMSEEEWDDAIGRLLPDLYREVVRLGGTISGEHGIGRKRARYLDVATSEAERTTMIAVKRALDPKGILNPGVIFNDGSGDHPT